MAEETVYLIDIDKYKAIARFDGFAEAVKFADASKYNYHLATSSAYLYTYAINELVKLHNNHVKSSGAIKKFKSMAEGITHTWDVILYSDIPINPELSDKHKGDSNMAFGADKEDDDDKKLSKKKAVSKKSAAKKEVAKEPSSESSSKKRAVAKKKAAKAAKDNEASKPAKKGDKEKPGKVSKKKAPVAKKASKPADKPAGKAKKETVASTFRKHIIDGLSEKKVLEKVRKAFPDKDFPDSYYKFYVKECIKKGLIEE